MMAEYYRRRAGTGLMFTGATSVTPMGVGYLNTLAFGPPLTSAAAYRRHQPRAAWQAAPRAVELAANFSRIQSKFTVECPVDEFFSLFARRQGRSAWSPSGIVS
jgi:hypothetical protein